MTLYFGPDVDVAITDYQSTSDPYLKNQIFSERIRPAMMRLIENQMYMYHFFKIDDPEMLKNDALSFLFETIPKFNTEKGTKAFSYFNVVLKRWFVGKIRDKKRKARHQCESIHGIENELVASDPSMRVSSREDEIILDEFWRCLVLNMDEWKKILKERNMESEIEVLNSICFLLQNAEMISIFNRKAILLYIREITKLPQKRINHAISELRELYIQFREDFRNG